MLTTHVGLSPVCTSLTSTPFGTGKTVPEPSSGAAAIPLRKFRRFILAPPGSQSHVQRGNQSILHAEVVEERIFRVFKIIPGPEERDATVLQKDHGVSK